MVGDIILGITRGAGTHGIAAGAGILMDIVAIQVGAITITEMYITVMVGMAQIGITIPNIQIKSMVAEKADRFLHLPKAEMRLQEG